MKICATVFLSLALFRSTWSFQCTGFDPVYSPEYRVTKTALYVAHKYGTSVKTKVQTSSLPILPQSLPSFDQAQHGHHHHHHHHHHHLNSVPRTNSFAPNTLSSLRLDKVSLEDNSLLAKKQAINLEYITWLNPDSILYNFRNTSNLPLQGATPFGGWEAFDCLLRGHFAGHWLSASALAANATGNATIRQHALYVVSELAKCQSANSALYGPVSGYLSGFPSSQFDDLENLVPYPKQWSPYYTIHKIFAGLRDHYIFIGNPVALQIMEGMASYFLVRIRSVIEKGTMALWHAIMNQEFGGMNEVGYDLYELTGNKTYLELAHYFDKPCWLGPLSVDNGDQLDTMHANAHEPIVIGAARRYEVLNDTIYSTMTDNFQKHLTEDHAYSTGNGNHGEYWSVPGRLGDTLDGDTQESCTSYNLLKIDKHLLSWSGAVDYADHYEKLFTNGILSTQNPTTFGSMIYMLPISTVNGTSKGWGDPIFSMTCCYGTGIETHAKLMESIYMQAQDPSGVPALFVLQYHSSNATLDNVADWNGASFIVQQSSVWDDDLLVLKASFTVISSPSSQASINLRIPSWTTSSAIIYLNGNALPDGITPSSWSNITRTWTIGDVLVATFPLSPIKFEFITDDRAMYSTTASIIAGPFVLVAPSIQGSALYGDINSPETWIQPVSKNVRNSTVSFSAQGGGPGMYIAHDESGNMFNLNVRAVDVYRDAADSSFILTDGLSGSAPGTVSIESVNYPSFYVCAKQTTNGSPFVVLDPNVPSNQITPGDCTFVAHTPGLSGIANSTSFELLSTPGSYLSWFGGGNGVTLQKLQGGEVFANMSTFLESDPLWTFPPFSFIASASLAAKTSNGARDFLLFPIAHAVYETYVTYFQVSQ
jgi:uncharacterized protein